MRKRRTRQIPIVLLFTAALVMASTLAFAQGAATTATLSGVVTDTSGAIVPGADVLVKDNARGTEYQAVTASNGGFSVPSLLPGTYTVTVKLSGFKTVVLSNVVMNAGVANAVKVVLEVGALEETVTVQAQTEIVQTQTAAVAQTLTTKQITVLPLTSRSVMDFLENLPGVTVASNVRNGNISGLPSAAVNITLDGMNVQDNFNKSFDGMFSLISPRIDAIEEVSVSSAASSADMGGQGAAQIRFTTRGGTNDFRGSAYLYYRDQYLNANSWFNVRDHIAKPPLMQRQPGARFGGPVFKDKLFFFVNYEEQRTPSAVSRTKTILSPLVEQGKFAYLDTAGNVQTIDLLNFTGKDGVLHTSAEDPTMKKLLADIRNATTQTGSVTNQTNPLYQSYSFNLPVTNTNRFPTTRIDYNINSKHRVTGVVNYQKYYGDRDTTNGYEGQFPGAPAYDGQQSKRYAYSTTLRSVLTSNMINEFQYGGSGAPVYFRPLFSPSMFNGSTFNQAGFALSLFGNADNAAPGSSKSSRNAWDRVIQDTLNWMKGSHSLTFGFLFTKFEAWNHGQNVVPSLSFGLVSDPCCGTDAAMNWLTAANLPAGVNVSSVQDLYGFLTGHVKQISGNARLDNSGQYVYMGEDNQLMRMNTFAGFASDSWRLKPNLTLTGGLRYEVILPFEPLNSNWATASINDVFGVTGPGNGFVPGSLVTGLGNLFSAGTLQGTPCRSDGNYAFSGSGPAYTCFTQYKAGVNSYKADWNNLAPSVGVNWGPSIKSRILQKILGDQPILRGGFQLTYSRNGLGDFSGVYNSNPGGRIDVVRNTSNGNLGTVPLLLSQPGTLGPASFNTTPDFPLTASKTSSVNIFDPSIQIPYAQTYSFGLQRVLTRQLAAEVRYVGTRSRDGWTTYDYNEIDIVKNHFIDEFKNAMANLAYNVASGKGNTFAYTGPGTSPLPIYLAYFQGLGAPAANDPKNYTSSYFKNANYYQYLAQQNPQPLTAATASGCTSRTNPTYGLNCSQTFIDNAVKAGLAPNFFMVNPDVRGGANITSNGGYTKYDSVQAELRYRPARGLRFETSYAWAQQWGSSRYSFKVQRVPTLDTGSSGGIAHTFRANWVYELPFGQGRRFAGNVGRAMDNVVGGWSVNGIVRIQSGRLVDLGNVRPVNMTRRDVEKLFKLRIDPATQKVYMFAQDIIDNTVRAFDVNAVSATGYGTRGVPTGRYFAPANSTDCMETINNGYGQCGTQTLVVTGPTFARLDLSLAKRINVTRTINFEFMAQIINVLNRVNFNPVGGIGRNPDSFEIRANNGGAADMRTTQLSFRINW